MERRRLGTTDLLVSCIGMGCAPLGSRYGKRDSARALEAAFERGINFFDTAPSYGQGDSEAILGGVFRRRRGEVVIATKVGHGVSPLLRAASAFKPAVRAVIERVPGVRRYVQRFIKAKDKPAAADYEPGQLARSVEASLRRLGSDYIDLLLLHSPSPQMLSRDGVFEELQALRRAGKIRHFGVSLAATRDGMLSVDKADRGVAAIQVCINLFERHALREVVPEAHRRGVGVIAREALAHGALIPDGGGPRRPNMLAYDDAFGFLAGPGRTMTQAAVAYVAGAPGVTSVVAGMSTPAHVGAMVDSLRHPPSADERSRVEARPSVEAL